VLFDTGGTNAANNRFVGNSFIADAGHEGEVQQIVASGATFTTMRCHVAVAAAGSTTYTLRVNGGNSTLTCTIAGGQTNGSGSGSVTVSAGDSVDVATPGAGTPGQPASFAVGG